MIRRILLLALGVATIPAGVAIASGNVPHLLGHGGPHIKLDAMCHRAVVAPPGETLKMDVNVVGQQVHCLIRRPDPFARCVKQLGPVPTVKIVRKDDWVGVRELRDYVAAIAACSSARLK